MVREIEPSGINLDREAVEKMEARAKRFGSKSNALNFDDIEKLYTDLGIPEEQRLKENDSESVFESVTPDSPGRGKRTHIQEMCQALRWRHLQNCKQKLTTWVMNLEWNFKVASKKAITRLKKTTTNRRKAGESAGNNSREVWSLATQCL